MKIDTFSNASRPRIATFNEQGDSYTITIVEEPCWTDDPLNSGRLMLKVVGQDDRGIYWQLNARSQMPDGIFDAMIATGVDEIVPGGWLTVKWVDMRGQTKIYAAEYAPPELGEAGF